MNFYPSRVVETSRHFYPGLTAGVFFWYDLQMKNLAFVSSSRADFGKMLPLIEAASELGHKCFVFCTGLHFRDSLGFTWMHVREKCDEHGWGFFPWYINDMDYPSKSAEVYTGIRIFLGMNDIDLLVVHGDRAEALGAAMASLNGQRVAHVEGGEISSTADEISRHAITKLSQIHLVSSKVARNRVVQMGEHEDSVFIVGSPDIDVLIDKERRPTLEEVHKQYPDLAGLSAKKGYGVVMYHPVSFYKSDQQVQAARNVAEALTRPKQWLIIGTNDDVGWEAVAQALQTRKRDLGKFAAYIPSMRFEHFVTALENSAMIVGNSSCGIMEAPVLGIPTIDVGPRQDGRAKEFGIGSITQVRDDTASEIAHAIDTLWGRSYKPDFSFGNGDTGDKFAAVLSGRAVWQLPLQKQFVVRSHKAAPKYSKRRYV